MVSLQDHLKPTHDEIVALALRETDPRQVDHFESITRGPAWAIASLVFIALLAVPSACARLLRGSWRTLRES